MASRFHPRPFSLTPIADTSDRFSGFAPYVPSINNEGLVAFQAALRCGGSGVFTGRGGAISTLIDRGTHSGIVSDILSHPDINRNGDSCCYARLASGAGAVCVLRHGHLTTLTDSPGPLGPTMNDDGTVAFRAGTPSGHEGIFAAHAGAVTTIAQSGEKFSAFHGLPVINQHGAVVFRADLTAGGQAICIGRGGDATTIIQTGEAFGALGLFPTINNSGTVAFCATLPDGGAGVFVSHEGKVEKAVGTGGPFESFRGVLLDNRGMIVFYATPRAGQLGIFTGPDPRSDGLFSLGSPLRGSAVTDFALNPVSINDRGQLAVRVALADQRQFILRADPG